MHKIKKGDEVIVTRGKSKGVKGKVLRVVENYTKVVVEGANLVKKTMKPNPNTNTRGGIIEREAALPVCNVAIYNPVSKKADKVGFKKLENGRKVRYFKSNNELIDLE